MGGGVFIGEYIHRMDINRGIVIPAAFRKLLLERAAGERRVILLYTEALLVYPADEFERLISNLRGEEHTREARRVFASAYSAAWGKRGRLTLPETMCVSAGIIPGCDVVISGGGNCFEIRRAEPFE